MSVDQGILRGVEIGGWLLVALLLWQSVRALHRIGPGPWCRQCGYSLWRLEGPTCPECGASLKEQGRTGTTALKLEAVYGSIVWTLLLILAVGGVSRFLPRHDMRVHEWVWQGPRSEAYEKLSFSVLTESISIGRRNHWVSRTLSVRLQPLTGLPPPPVQFQLRPGRQPVASSDEDRRELSAVTPQVLADWFRLRRRADDPTILTELDEVRRHAQAVLRNGPTLAVPKSFSDATVGTSRVHPLRLWPSARAWVAAVAVVWLLGIVFILRRYRTGVKTS